MGSIKQLITGVGLVRGNRDVKLMLMGSINQLVTGLYTME